MATFETVRVAAIQATPVILDADATVGKAVDLLNTAADEGVQLAVLPETFVSLYPSGSWAYKAARFGGFDQLWERMWESSVDVPGPLVDRIAAICGERDIWCVIGVNERESERPGSLYNSMLTIGPQGLVPEHRKLMATQHERILPGVGADCDLRVGLHAKRFFDAVGHYGREDVLMPAATLTNPNGSPQAEAITQPHE